MTTGTGAGEMSHGEMQAMHEREATPKVTMVIDHGFGEPRLCYAETVKDDERHQAWLKAMEEQEKELLGDHAETVKEGREIPATMPGLMLLTDLASGDPILVNKEQVELIRPFPSQGKTQGTSIWTKNTYCKVAEDTAEVIWLMGYAR